MSFKDLGLSENIMKAIIECGYETPTPIQAQAIPHILMARDVVGLAQTGTGKTASFTLPMIEILAGGRAKARMPRSLILTPTRELAAQIAENFDTYGKYTKLSKALLVGGVSMDDQIKNLERGVDVLIATPGRLMDLFERGRILLNDIKILVIDEADRMLDMGFIPDIEKIASLLPPMRQTLLFSATMPPAIKKLTAQFLSNPREVSVSAPATTVDKVEQYLIWTDRKKKDGVLLDLIKKEQPGTAFIFCNRKRDIDGLCRFLTKSGLDAKALHGDMDQKSRTMTLDLLRDGKIKFLVCSDVAGRGIDVDHVTHVFNYDVPMQADDYVHRIGRTGRAGRSGKALMFAVPGADDKFVSAIEGIIKKPIPVLEVSQTSKVSVPSEKKADKPDRREPRREPVAKKPEQAVFEQKALPPKKKPAKEKSESNSFEDVQGFGDDIPSFMR
jgi:superfamily II DNA/RNA helicase